MPPVNATATTSRTVPNPIQTALSPPANKLSSAQVRNSSTARNIEIVPERAAAGSSPTPRDSKLPIPCPVYSSILGADDIPESWKKSSIYDQASLEKSWSKVVVQLQDGHVSEKDVYQTLKSGFLQTPTGKVLAPLFIESIMRSIRPLGDLKQEQLREFVEVICLFPPARWADSFGENVNFPRGKYGEGVHGIIQDQLTATRAERDQKIADGELLDDDTWQALRDFTQQTRQYIPASSDAELNAILTQLEDLVHIRPSPKEAKLLMDDFVEAMNEQRPNEFQRWPENFSAIVQKFSERLKAIEIIDNRPDRTWLEEIVAIGALSPVSLKDVGGAASSAVKMAYDFVFGGKTEPAPPEKMQGPSASKLLLAMQEIERTSSFYDEVVMTGPGVPNGLAAKMLYAVNAMHTVGLMDVLPNLPLTSPATSPTALAILPKTATVHTPSTLKEQVEGLAAEVDDFMASIKSATRTGSEETISNDPGTAEAPTSSSVLQMVGQLAQTIRDVLDAINDPLRFPTASASPENIPMLERELGEALDAAERGDSLHDAPVYGATVESSPSQTWRETLAPVINQLVSQLASVLNTFGGYAVGAAASGYQLARNNPGTTATVGLIGTGGILTALGTYLTFFKEQLPEQPATDKELTNTPPREEEAPALTQQQIDNELGSDTATSVNTHSTPIAISTPDEPKTTVDTTVTAESGEVTTPLDSTTLPQKRVDEETTVVTADSMPDADPAIVETAASEQERVDGEIVNIVNSPSAEDQSPLSEAILELMYQSPEHNLLSDEHLLHEVALLLNQHTQSDPGKTYVDLILAAEAGLPVQTQPPQSQTTTQSTPRQALGPIKVKRAADFFAPPPLPHLAAMIVADDDDVPASPISDEARLDQYLATMAVLQNPEVAPDLEIENDIGTADDPALSVARDVIVLLRGRRSALWMDASRAAGDKELLTRYTDKVLASQEFPMTDATVVVPTHSTFGQSYLNFKMAITNPFFKEWAAKVGLDLATVKVHLDTNRISGRANGHRTQFTLTDGLGLDKVSGPIFKAARVISPTHHTVKYPLPGGAVSIQQVAGFYGERELPDMASAQWRAKELIANGAFFQLPADDPLRPAELRSEAAVKSLKQHLGDLYSLHQLVTGLKSLIQGKSDDARVKLDDVSIGASPDSTFALKHPVEAQKMVTVHRYISANGWTVPTNVAQVRNLVEVLTTPFPVSPETGNFWGALAYPRPLTSSQQTTITRATSHFLGSSEVSGLLEYLLQDKSFTTPSQGLQLALNAEEANTLDETVRVKLNALPTKHSKNDWVSAALLLDLDPTPGRPRNHVAGYDLTQQANLGRKPSEVVSDFEKYLVAQGKVTARTAPVAAYHLLAGSAPELLVKDIPENLIYNTHTWTMFRIAVSQIEQLSPGASLGMKFADIMKYGDLEPISVGQEIAVQWLSVNPLIDWAIASGVIPKNASDSYTPEQLKIAGEKFQSVREELAKAGGYLTAPVPTREALAKAELERVFGKNVPFEAPCFRTAQMPSTAPGYSLLDIYITGRFEAGKWTSSNSEIPIATVETKLPRLENAAQLFEREFNNYYNDLQTGSQSIFKHLVSQLPIEDRRSLEYGTQTFYSVRSEAIVEELTPEVKDNHKGRHGILMVSKYGDMDSVYELFTSPPMIRKRTDLPLPLPLGGRPRTVMSPDNPGKYITIVGAMPYPVDSQAYQEGMPPREGKISPVIIDQMFPQTLRTKLTGFGYTSGVMPNAFAPGSWASHIADVMVKEHFITGREQLRELAAGVTTWEEEQAHSASVMRFFESLIPFKTCIDNIQSGNVGDAVVDCTLDAAGFVIPGIGVAGKVAQVVKSGAKLGSKILDSSRIIIRYIVTNANPLDGAVDTMKGLTNAVGYLATRAYSAVNKGAEQLRNLYGTSKAVDPVFVSKRADIAEGTVGAASVGAQAEKVKAVFKGGKWYDFNPVKNEAYGPPLENFTPDSAIALERTTFIDGSTALTNSRLFDAEPHILKRSTHTDIVIGKKVYRLDPENPGLLNDLSSPVYFKELEGFETVCSLGGRSKRDTTKCFSKIVKESRNTAVLRMQSIEHKRLYPTNGNPPLVVHERRIYNCADPVNPCSPQQLTAPMAFKVKTTGSIIDDKQFGLFGRIIDPVLEAKTRVVKIDGIIHNLEDKRDVRAFIVEMSDGNVKTKYLVAEVDTGLFYYCRMDDKLKNNIEFIKADFTDEGFVGDLLKRYHDIKNPYVKQVTLGSVHNEDLVILPTLNDMYKKLSAIGLPSDEIDFIKKAVATFTEAEQREFILQIWDKRNVRDIQTAIPAIKIEKPPLPMGFRMKSKSDQNEYYAYEAKRQVDKQLKATGLGPFNQRILSNAQDMRRVGLTQSVVLWEYSMQGVPNKFEIILKTGAGNCDQMAQVAAAIIATNGGTATRWHSEGHVFTLVGGPRPGTIASTIDFDESAFEHAWVVDVWANLVCMAKDYTTELAKKMVTWSAEKKQIIATDWRGPVPTSVWMDPTNPQWIDKTVLGPKTPS